MSETRSRLRVPVRSATPATAREAESPAVPAPRTTSGTSEAAASAERWQRGARAAIVVIPTTMVVLVLGAVTFVDGFAREALFRTASLLCPVSVVIGLRAHRPRHPTGWHLALAGVLVWAIAGFVDSYSVLTGTVPALDVFGMTLSWWTTLVSIGYLPLLAAVISWERSRWRHRPLDTHLESAILLVGLGILGWQVAVQPALTMPGLTPGERFPLVFFPVADILLVTVLVRMLASTVRGPALYAMLMGGTAILFADVITEWARLTGFDRPSAGPILWLAGATCVSVAVLHPSMRTLADAVGSQDTGLSRGRVGFLVAALLGPPLALAVHTAHGGENYAPHAVAIAASSGLVLARMALLMRGIQRQSSMLDQSAVQDHLTELPNRRSADLMLASALVDARPDSFGLSSRVVVTMLGLDHFRQLNEGLGHLAGDRLLALAARLWSEHLTRHDRLTRYTGETFMLISTGRTIDEVSEAVRGMRSVTPMRQTFSAGIADWDGQETADTLIGRAHGGMLLARERGRACTVIAGTRSRVDHLHGAAARRAGRGGGQ